VLGSVLTILGFKCVKRSEANSNAMIFWLSDSESEDRECDATAIITPGKLIRFDIGFIGSGNPEITKDKISRFSRAFEMDGKKTTSKTIIIVDRLPKKGSTERSAKAIGTEVVQMSHKYWPRELAIKPGKLEKSYQHQLMKMKDTDIGSFIIKSTIAVNIEDFIGKLDISTIEMQHEKGSATEVQATISSDGED
jgi:hypothetical protein